jgi:hypothetical protein
LLHLRVQPVENWKMPFDGAERMASSMLAALAQQLIVTAMSEKMARVTELEERITDLKARLPKHSVPPAMIIELEELEEALERARAEAMEEESS